LKELLKREGEHNEGNTDVEVTSSGNKSGNV